MSTGLWQEEQVVPSLCALYGRYGYTPYKMSKFEEYDLYVRNKDFLISDSVITFTDTNGRLMALKPDVTLSIVKNSGDLTAGVRKVYYDENVYRVSGSAHAFREIRQVGLECLGELDWYSMAEVVSLAAESLRAIAREAVLDVSHLGVITGLLDRMEVPQEARAAILKCIGEKNPHELARTCAAAGIEAAETERLCRVAALYGHPAAVLEQLRQLLGEAPESAWLAPLMAIWQAVKGTPAAACVRLDMSVVGDVRYYNGIVFKGFVNGVPGAVLSGGQYDRLLHKMGKPAGAVGFAVYLDMLDSLYGPGAERDVDDVLLYSEEDAPARVSEAVRQLQAEGRRVLAVRERPEKLDCLRVWQLTEKGVELRETHA